MSKGAQYYQLQKQGYSYSEIAAKTGAVSRNAVASVLRRYRARTGAERVHDGSVYLRPRSRRKKIYMAAEAVNSLGVNMLDLKHGQCRYPYGTKPYNFCGREAVKGGSYCQEHDNLCYKDRGAE